MKKYLKIAGLILGSIVIAYLLCKIIEVLLFRIVPAVILLLFLAIAVGFGLAFVVFCYFDKKDDDD